MELTSAQLSILEDGVIEGGDAVYCKPPLMVNPEQFGFPVVHVDIENFNEHWHKTRLAVQPDGLNCIGTMGWLAKMKMPLYMPYADNALGMLDNGNHTFSVLYHGGYSKGLDIVVRPDVRENVWEKFGMNRPEANPLPEAFLATHRESLSIGLNLLQKGMVVGGFIKHSTPSFEDGLWINDEREELSSSGLARIADRSHLLWAAQSVLRLHLKGMLNPQEWIGMSETEQLKFLKSLCPVDNIRHRIAA